MDSAVGFDAGGILPPGQVVAVNTSGQPKLVLTAEQINHLREQGRYRYIVIWLHYLQVTGLDHLACHTSDLTMHHTREGALADAWSEYEEGDMFHIGTVYDGRLLTIGPDGVATDPALLAVVAAQIGLSVWKGTP